MIKYHEIVRLLLLGTSLRKIALSTRHSRSAVSKVVKKLDELNIRLEELVGKTDLELKTALFPKELFVSKKKLPNFGAMRKELARPGMTKKLLWAEYVQDCNAAKEPALSYSQFCFYFQQEEAKHRVTMHIARKPAERIEVDWSGDLVDISDPQTGKTTQAHIFVGVLSYSQYTFAEAFPDEKLDSWILAHVHMFEYFGGVARELVPDNCKTAVEHHRKDDILLNTTYREMAEFYSTIILPARVRKPRDKGPVESGVGCVQRLVLAPMRNDQCFSLAELNRKILNQLSTFNNLPFQKKDGSRRSLFEEEEKPLLLPLPSARFEVATWKIATVQVNYHVSVEGKMYSVPYEYVGKKVDVKITQALVEVYFNHGRIASHCRSYDSKVRYVTVTEHMPKNHQEVSKWNGESLRDCALKIGVSTYTVIDEMLKSKKVEQQAYRSCLAVLGFRQKYSEALLELACKEAVAVGSISLKAVRTALEALKKKESEAKETANNSDEQPNPHGLTRGSEYFERSES